MARLGMDVDEVENCAKQIKAQGDELGHLIAKVESLVNRLPGIWDGDDAKRFVHEWPSHKGKLNSLVNELHTFGQKAITEAGQQRQTSH